MAASQKLIGEPIDARQAVERGLVNRAVPEERLDAEVARYAQIIAARAPAVIAAGKRAFYRQIDLQIGDAYATASEAMAGNLSLPEAAEGLQAFLEKRAPAW